MSINIIKPMKLKKNMSVTYLVGHASVVRG